MNSELPVRHLEPGGSTRGTLLCLGVAALAAVSVEPLGNILALPGLWFWIAVMAVALAIPFIVQWRQSTFEPFTPLTFPAWTYLGPVFVVGSAVLAAGIAKQTPDLIPAPMERYYCLAMAYLVVGWVSLLVGYYSRWGEVVGSYVRNRLPRPDWSPAEMRLPAALVLAVGLGFHWLAFRVGVVGHQRLEVVGPYDGLLIFLSFVSQIAAFLLWFSLFARPSWSRGERALAAALYLLGPVHLVISASRAGLLTHLVILALAFRLAGRRIRWRHVLLFGLLAVMSLALGTAWNTTYRLQKGSEAPVYRSESPREEPADSVATPKIPDTGATPKTPGTAATPKTPDIGTEPSKATNLELLTATAQTTAERGLHDNALLILRNVAVRLEITSSVATLVANYHRLQPLEAELGLAGNIWRDTWTSPVPRFLWPGKPKASDARTYSLVYFQYGENSFAITPVGDLLRNFGPVGIALGMALLGLALRLLYGSLVAGLAVQPAQAAVYTVILMNLSYEGFYGSILPTVMRLLVVAGVALSAIHLGVALQRRFRRSGGP